MAVAVLGSLALAAGASADTFHNADGTFTNTSDFMPGLPGDE